MSCKVVNNNTCSLQYCDNMRNIDNMLKIFSREQSYVIELLEKDPKYLTEILWSKHSPLSIDNKCLCNMGKMYMTYELSDKLSGKCVSNENIANYFKCAQCVNMSRIVELDEYQINTPFPIECGRKLGRHMIILMDELIRPAIAYTDKPNHHIKRVLRNDPYISSCQPDVNYYSNIKYITSDYFTNQILVSWYTDHLLSRYHIKGVCQLHTAFICQNKGYSLFDYPDIGRLHHLAEQNKYLAKQGKSSATAKMSDYSPFSTDVSIGIIKQLFSMLHILQANRFSHGRPSSRALLLDNAPTGYVYDKVKVDSPVTLQLCDLSESAITIKSKTGPVRLYNHSPLLEAQMNNVLHEALVDNLEYYDSDTGTTVSYFQLKNYELKELSAYRYLKNIGAPVYLSAYDAYAFFVILMSNVPFYQAVMTNDKLTKLWKSIWLPAQYQELESHITELHHDSDPMTNYLKVFDFLASGYYLRCDMVNHIWNYIRTHLR